MSSTHMKFEKRVCELLYYLLFSTVIGKLQKKIELFRLEKSGWVGTFLPAGAYNH